MDEHQQYIIYQQSLTNIKKYQQILSIWSQLYQEQKQQQIFQVITSPHYLINNVQNAHNAQNQQKCPTAVGICHGKLVVILKYKFYVVFTEYLESMKKMLVNVEFQEIGFKRSRRYDGDFAELIIDRIEANYLFSQEQIRIFTTFLQNHHNTRQLIADFIEKASSIYVDQILYSLYTICSKFQHLLILDQQHKNNQVKLQEQITTFSEQIVRELVSSSKIKELSFEQYQEQHACTENNQKYFIELIMKWVTILIDSENINTEKYKQQIEEAETDLTADKIQQKNIFCFDSGEDDETGWQKHHRKVRPTSI